MNYTHEDLIALNEIVKGDKSILFDMKILRSLNPLSGIFNSDIMKDTPIDAIVEKFIGSLFSVYPGRKEMMDQKSYDELKDQFKYVFLEAPLDEMPLYINECYNMNVIAKWRLQIGK